MEDRTNAPTGVPGFLAALPEAAEQGAGARRVGRPRITAGPSGHSSDQR